MRPPMRLVLAAAALALGAAAPRQASAQFTVACAPGVGCTQLRFTYTASGPVQVNSLSISLFNTPFTLVSGFAPGIGTYTAVDAIGAFGGFSAIDATGKQIDIDFAGGAGFPFELTAAGESGYVQLEGTFNTPTLPDGLVANITLTPPNGAPITGTATLGPAVSSVPEPATVLLMATGLGVVGIIARRRRSR